jgi:tetratricopeptide (TPR) repeat protein
MKHTVYILTLIGFIYGCQPKQLKKNNFMDDIREDFAKQAEEQNEKIYDWEEKIEILYERADKNLQRGVEYADSLIENDKSLDKWKISNLHSIVGELYYDNDSIVQALERFHLNQTLTFDSPRNKANKAGCYVKMGDFDKAMTLLEQASETNHDFKWYIGNLYEIKGEPEKAILEYDYVYRRDTLVYALYNQRIQELSNNPNQLMTELYYKDRRKRTLILLKGVDSDASETAIGKIKLEKR